MSFDKTKFDVVQKRKIAKTEINVECNVPVDIAVDKVLSVCHAVNLVSNDAGSISAQIDLNILCQTIDGEIVALNSSCPFTSKVEMSSTDRVVLDFNIIDTSIESVTNSNIKIVCVVEQSGYIIEMHEIETIESVDENICAKSDSITLCAIIKEASEVFNVESELSIKEAIKKIVACESCLSIKAVESGVDFVSVSGDVISRLVYLSENEKYETMTVTEQFKEEVEASGVTRDSICEAYGHVIQHDLKCEVEMLEKGVNVHITTPICLNVFAYENRSVEVVSDLYSTKQDLAVSTESFNMTKVLAGDYFEGKIDGDLNLEESEPRIDKVLFVAGTSVYVSNAYHQNDEVFVEGVAKANVIYLNDEVGTRAVTIEVPFVASTRSGYENISDITASVALVDVDVSAKKGRDLFIDGKLKIKTAYSTDEISAVISNANLSGDEITRDCQVELVFGKTGMTAWDISKHFKIREETLISQNPNITFPLASDERLIIYYN